jgi:FAD synthetase
MRKNYMKTVVATGTFSILHPGHLLFLREAKKLGDKLIVIVARDKIVKKKKLSILIPEEQRLEVIKGIKFVDEALLGDKGDIFKPIERIKPDIIALGKDQDFDEKILRDELKKRKLNAKVIRIKSYWDDELNSTKKIIQRIRTELGNR